MCIFCKIAKKQLTSYIVYEDEEIMAFLDAFPIKLGHVLIITKKHYKNFLEIPLNNKIETKMLAISKKIMHKLELNLKAKGFSLGTNINEEGGQEIMHFHWHIIPYGGEQHNKHINNRLQLSQTDFKRIQNLIKL